MFKAVLLAIPLMFVTAKSGQASDQPNIPAHITSTDIHGKLVVCQWAVDVPGKRSQLLCMLMNAEGDEMRRHVLVAPLVNNYPEQVIIGGACQGVAAVLGALAHPRV